MRFYNILFATIFACYNLSSNAQLIEHFTDNNFTSDPLWTGDTSAFSVKAGILELDAPAIASEQCLSTKSNIGLEAQWSISIALDFNPSSSNYCKIYLMSDKSDLKASSNAYFVKLGGSNDDVSLYKQEGLKEIKIIDGRNQVLNKSLNKIQIEVSRNKDHLWELKTDSGASTFLMEGTATDSVILISRFFGISCKYTSSRSDKFSFDDISIFGKSYKDTIGPQIINHHLIDSNIWRLEFDEVLNKSCLNKDNLSGFWAGADIDYISSHENTLDVIFKHSFPRGAYISLQLDSICDSLMNSTTNIVLEALSNGNGRINFKEILINEIMFDPTPAQNLPLSEYIELYNRSDYYFNLSNYVISDEKDSLLIPEYILPPKEYVLLISKSDSALYKQLSNRIVLMESFSLGNTGENIRLQTSSGQIMDSVNYSPSWILDNNKVEGGWSIELINPNFLCSSKNNWAVCTNDDGGSPGYLNSVFDEKFLDSLPHLNDITSIYDTSITVSFTGSLLPQVDYTDHLSSSPHLEFKQVAFSENSLNMSFVNDIHSATKYTINFSGLLDCFINEVFLENISFHFPERVEWNDLIINEILFNPYTGGSDFVELHNRSEKYIDLSKLIMVGINENGSPEIKPISENYLNLPPGGHIALCEDQIDILTRYPVHGRTFETHLPALNNDFGRIHLYNQKEEAVEIVYYSEDMHLDLINDLNGISLERINSERPGTNMNNWHSASSSIGYASPGHFNSQSSRGGMPSKELSVYPDVFSPDNDAFNDILFINYSFDQSYIGSIMIINKDGQMVRQIASNESLSRSGQYVWDGVDESGRKAPIGYYIVYLEVYSLNGNTKIFRSTAVLANHI